MNHADRRIVHEVRSKKMASLVRIILREFSFLTGVYEVFDANYASEKTGEDPQGLKVCLRSTDEAENRNRAVVQKRPPARPPDRA